MNSERRNCGRRTLYSPEYLDMGADNGGVVVNLSEGGLGFQSVGPVLPESQIAVSFSLGPGYRIDVKARVVWVSPTGKTGGAVFGKLSNDSRSLIREWLAKPEVEHEVEHAVVMPEAEAEAAAVTAEAEPAAVPSNGASAQQAAVDGGERTAALSGTSELPLDVQSPPVVAPRFAATPEPGVALPPTQTPVPAAPRQERVSLLPGRQQARRPPAVEATREQQGGESFSVVPSIAAWSRNDAPPRQRVPPPARGDRPLFPPRNTDNIFARSPSRMEIERGRRGSGVLMILAIIIAAGALVAFYGRTYRNEIGNAIVRLGNRVSGAAATSSASTATLANAPAANTGSANAVSTPSTSQGAAPTPAAPAPATNALSTSSTAGQTGGKPPATSARPQTAPANAPATLATPQSTHPNAVQGTAFTPARHAATSGQAMQQGSKAAPSNNLTALPYAGQSEYNRAEQYLNGKGVEQDPAEAAEWFWRSLEAGYTEAAIPLADLYIAGNGVSRSCTQARVLLDAAAQKNIPEAVKKLGELPENCQ